MPSHGASALKKQASHAQAVEGCSEPGDKLLITKAGEGRGGGGPGSKLSHLWHLQILFPFPVL